VQPDLKKTDSGLPVPPNCTDPELGQVYWKFVHNFMAIPSCRMRLAVLKHTTSCPACFARVLEMFQELSASRPENPASECEGM
jgi:hypothetical protein